MKHQKSSFPYLFLLFALVVGLPVMDYSIEDSLTLEFEIDSTKEAEVDFPFENARDERFVTFTIQHPPQ